MVKAIKSGVFILAMILFLKLWKNIRLNSKLKLKAAIIFLLTKMANLYLTKLFAG